MRMRINPVLYSEMRMRMRGAKVMVLMTIYLSLLLVVFALLYRVIGGEYSYSYYWNSRPRPEGMELLIPMFAVLLFMLYGAIVLMVPALNAGNIAAEREKQTLDLLIISRISAIKIIMGKLLSNLAFVVFLLVLALPLFAVVYLFGSIMIFDIVRMFLYMVVSAYACASLATFFSALVKKTAIATMLTYLALILFLILSLVVGFYLINRNYSRTGAAYRADYFPLILRINPGLTLLELLAQAEGNAGTGSDFMGSFLDEMNFSLMAYSTAFMLIASPLLNIASAILIKPVQKFQFRMESRLRRGMEEQS